MTRHKKVLRGLEDITELLKLVFLSGNIDGEKPLSCLLVAPVSSGKTVTVKQFKNNKNILITTDSTAFGLLKSHQNALKTQKIRHILIPDLLNALARRKTTQDQLILFINSSSEDGLFPSTTYGMEITEKIPPFGWVMCLTTEAFERKKKFLKNIGFLSRFFVVQYQYNIDQIKAILQDVINEEQLIIPDIKVKNSIRKKKIAGNSSVFEKLLIYSRLLVTESESEIIRMQRKLQILCKASAYERGSDKVTNTDLERVERLIYLIKK